MVWRISLSRRRNLAAGAPSTILWSKARLRVAEIDKKLKDNKAQKAWQETLRGIESKPEDLKWIRGVLEEFITKYPASDYVEEARRRITKAEARERQRRAESYVEEKQREVETLCKEGRYGEAIGIICLLYTSPSPRDLSTSRMPSSA